nr:binding-protein-dependent transport system inner membrane protein [Raoultella sp. NCTC 9187]
MLSSVALLAVISITLSAVITLSSCRPIVQMLAFLYRLPLFIPFIVAAQMMRTFLAKNGLMNNALVASDLLTPMETLSWLGWKGIIITFVWKQLAFATLLICGAMAALERSQILAARNLGASRPRSCSILFCRRCCPHRRGAGALDRHHDVGAVGAADDRRRYADDDHR